jgi:hypothetical protein
MIPPSVFARERSLNEARLRKMAKGGRIDAVQIGRRQLVHTPWLADSADPTRGVRDNERWTGRDQPRHVSLCPSCTARRMADTAAHLVDHVLPRAPYRQWVVTVPKALRLRLARDPGWTTWVGNLAVRAIGAWQRRSARQRGIRAPRTGAITFVQRFGGLVNLNGHFHLLVPDGVFVDADDRLAFALHPVPTSADVLAILDRIVCRIARRLADEASDDRVEDIDALAQVQAEAAATWRSPHNGKPTVRGVERLRAWCEGFSLHAGVVIADHDRDPPRAVAASSWAGDQVDAGDRRAGDVHRALGGGLAPGHARRPCPAASPHRLGGRTAYCKLPRRCSWDPRLETARRAARWRERGRWSLGRTTPANERPSLSAGSRMHYLQDMNLS